MMKIKMGKMEVDKNIKPWIFLILMLFSFLFFIMFSIDVVSIYIDTKDYVKVEATVIDIGYEHVPNITEGDSVDHYAVLQYEYNGKTYHCQKLLHMIMFYPKINSKTKIYIDPNVPTNFRNTWQIGNDILGAVLGLVFTIAMIKCYIEKK